MKIAILFFLLVFSISFGQQSNDSLKVISYDDQISIRANFDTNIEDYTLTNRDADLKGVLAINSKIKTTIGLDYQFLSAGISFAPSFLPGNNEDGLKGESSYTNISIQLFPGRFLQRLNYKNVKGFYLENTQDFLPNWEKGTDPYLQFPDFRVQTFGGSTSYFLNKNFSLKSLLFQREWQNFSSGSLVPSLDYDLTYFSDKYEDSSSKERQFNISTNLAYYYNYLVTPNFNIAPFISTGIGSKFSKFEDDESPIITKSNYFMYQYSAGIQAGYNTSQFFAGGKLNYSSNNYSDQSKESISNNQFYGLLFIGYRFAPPKFVKDSYEKIHSKLPFL